MHVNSVCPGARAHVCIDFARVFDKGSWSTAVFAGTQAVGFNAVIQWHGKVVSGSASRATDRGMFPRENLVAQGVPSVRLNFTDRIAFAKHEPPELNGVTRDTASAMTTKFIGECGVPNLPANSMRHKKECTQILTASIVAVVLAWRHWLRLAVAGWCQAAQIPVSAITLFMPTAVAFLTPRRH